MMNNMTHRERFSICLFPNQYVLPNISSRTCTRMLRHSNGSKSVGRAFSRLPNSHPDRILTAVTRLTARTCLSSLGPAHFRSLLAPADWANRLFLFTVTTIFLPIPMSFKFFMTNWAYLFHNYIITHAHPKYNCGHRFLASEGGNP